MSDSMIEPGPVMNREPYSDAEMSTMSDNLACESCGAPVPNFPEDGNTMLIQGDRLCSDCSWKEHDIDYTLNGERFKGF